MRPIRNSFHRLVWFLVLLAMPGARSVEADCVLVSNGLDPLSWNGSASTLLGEAIGQTFLARDTLMTILTVWRPPNTRSVIGAHLYITAVDTTWTPARPDVHQILLNGPTVRVYDSDPPGQLIQMDFVLNPPLALPRPGLYAWFLQAEDCWQGEPWIITARDDNPYLYGIYWYTGRVDHPCYLRDVAGGTETTDLIFRIEYCRPDPTPVRGDSWGHVKVIYR